MLNKNGTFYLILIGNTERNILDNTDEIIRKSLPTDRVISYYKEVSGACKDVVLGYVTFMNTVKIVSCMLSPGIDSLHSRYSDKPNSKFYCQ